jgi:hypothetical protein
VANPSQIPGEDNITRPWMVYLDENCQLKIHDFKSDYSTNKNYGKLSRAFWYRLNRFSVHGYH